MQTVKDIFVGILLFVGLVAITIAVYEAHRNLPAEPVDDLKILAKRSQLNYDSIKCTLTNEQVYIYSFNDATKQNDTLWSVIDTLHPEAKIFFSQEPQGGYGTNTGDFVPEKLHFSNKKLDSIYYSKMIK